MLDKTVMLCNLDNALLKVYGYKGVPIFALHPPFHLVSGFATDYLHCILLGVTKMLLEFWFDKDHRSNA